jgi:hypothetical protein
VSASREAVQVASSANASVKAASSSVSRMDASVASQSTFLDSLEIPASAGQRLDEVADLGAEGHGQAVDVSRSLRT